ncbi:MAG: hypothetical protein SFY96_11325 [Planctomycetota bacterium]|nr:hypothetical protein [Planctomycetota bacterium]
MSQSESQSELQPVSQSGEAHSPGGGPIGPALDIPLPPDRDGKYPSVSLRFDGAGRSLVIDRSENVGPGWWVEHALDITGPIVIMTALVLVMTAISVRRRPRSPQRRYCGGCNYELGPIHGVAPERCSECGVLLADEPSRPGRGGLRRMTPSLVVGVPVLLVSLWIFIGFAERPGGGQPTWPFAALGKMFPWWPIARAPLAIDVNTRRIVVGLPGAGEAGTPSIVLETICPSSQVFFSPDGRTLAWSEFAASTGWNIDAVIVDLATGQTKRVRMGSNSDGFITPAGFTPDGREAVFAVTWYHDPGGPPDDDGTTPSAATPKTAPLDIRIIGVDVATGAKRTIGTGNSVAEMTGQRSWLFPSVYAAAGPDGAWAMLSFTKNAPGTLTIHRRGETRTVPVTTTTPYAEEGLRFLADRSLAYASYQINESNGSLVSGLGDPNAWWSLETTPNRISLLSRSDGTSTGVRLNTDAAYEGSSYWMARVSPNEQWAASSLTVQPPNPPGRIMPLPSEVRLVRLWDLRGVKLAPALPPPPREPVVDTVVPSVPAVPQSP